MRDLAKEPEVARQALETMWTARRFEEAVDELFARGLMHGTMHLSIGQEASATGTCLALQPDDLITSTHRGHGHCVAKGADLTRMMAELLGQGQRLLPRPRRLDAHRRRRHRQPRRERHRRRRDPDRRRRRAGAEAAPAPARSWCASSATARPTRARSTRRRTWPRSGSCRWSSSARTTSYGMSMSSDRGDSRSRTSSTRAAAYGIPGVTVDGNDVQAVYETVDDGRRPGPQRRAARRWSRTSPTAGRATPRATRTSTAPARRSPPGRSATRSRASRRRVRKAGSLTDEEIAGRPQGGDRRGARRHPDRQRRRAGAGRPGPAAGRRLRHCHDR